MLKNKLDEWIAVITPIRQHMLAYLFTQQLLGLGDIMALTTRQDKVQRITQGIHFGVDFGTESAPTTAQGLRSLTTVFFDAPAAHG